jgi:hypothetical protein
MRGKGASAVAPGAFGVIGAAAFPRSARCRARVISSDMLVGEEKQDCGDFLSSVGWAGVLSLYAYCGSADVDAVVTALCLRLLNPQLAP